MSTTQLESIVLNTLDDHKAKDVINIDVRHLTSVTDQIIVCTGTSKRHVITLAEHLITNAKHNGVQPLGVEGKENGEWALVDLGDIVVHIMLSETREFYSLEKLWDSAERARRMNES